ncbi:hypothetical protein, partial [Klebsiella pneumoniae]|uniref:hypothetical protein n=1 Tax=Klebsiella pneumoniae TaxID=573 RepID=UPI001F4B2567
IFFFFFFFSLFINNFIFFAFFLIYLFLFSIGICCGLVQAFGVERKKPPWRAVFSKGSVELELYEPR